MVQWPKTRAFMVGKWLGSIPAILCAGLVSCGGNSTPKPYPAIDDLPSCNADSPSFECLKKLFLPLRETAWPFDKDAIYGAYVRNAFQVAKRWNLTALHVLDGQASFNNLTPDCYASEFEFAELGSSIKRKDCGTFLFLGGHPHAAECKAQGIPLMDCTDQVSVAETFDIGMVSALPTPGYLEVTDEVNVGDEVFLLGDPGFLSLLTSEETAWFDLRYPLVSSGRVIALDGRGMVLSNLAFPGNSGGPVLDKFGRALGVASTEISMLRTFGTPTDPALAGHRTVAVRIDAKMKARIENERAL